MSLRADAPSVLVAMGYVFGVDFTAKDSGSGLVITWLAGSAMPSEATINAYDLAAGQLALLRTRASALVDQVDSDRELFRAGLLTTLDALNRISKDFRDLLAAIAGAASLAALKTAAAAINPEPARTPLDLRNAVKAKATSGDAD